MVNTKNDNEFTASRDVSKANRYKVVMNGKSHFTNDIDSFVAKHGKTGLSVEAADV